VAGDADASVLLAPFSVRLVDGKIRQPDVLYMSGRNAYRRHERAWDGADCFSLRGDDVGAIYIFRGSHESRAKDRVRKLARSLPTFLSAMVRED
jgi:hypothetical protein